VHPAQRQAELWQRAGRPELLLLATLAEAEALLAAADGWTADERAFLEHSAAARRREAAARRSQRLVAGLAALVVVLGIAGLAGGLLYFRQARAYAQERLRASEREAAEQQREATAALRWQLTSQVVQHREAQASLAARLAVAAASLAPSPWDRKEPLLAATVGAPQLVDVLTPPPPPAGFGDAAERSTSRTLGGRRGYLRLTAGDPGELLALGRQGKIFRWTPAGRRVTALLPHGPAAEAFARHPTRPLLAVGWSVSTPEARGTYARLWDFERGAWASEPLLPAVDDGDRTLLSLEFSADGARLAALYEEPGDAPQCVGVVIEVATGTVLRSVEDEPSVRAMALSPDGGTLILGRWDGAIAARDVASGARTELKSPLLTADRAVSVIRYSRDGRRLFAGGGDRYAALWSVPPVPGADQVLAVRPGSDIVDALLLSDTLVVLACSGSCRDAELSLWRTESLDPIGTPVTLPGRTLTTIAGLGDGRIAAGGEDHSIYVVDPRLLRAQREHEAWPQDDGYLADVPVVAARPDAPAVAVAEADAQGVGSELRLVDAATGQASPLLRSPARVVALGFSRDAARLVVVDRGGQVQAVALPGGEVRPLGRVPWGEVPLALAFADDGTAVIAAATPQGGALAREGDGFAPATLGPARPAAAVALDAGARVLAVSTCAATASEGDCDLGAVQLYDVAAGSPRGEPMHGHAGAARALALSADGRRLASGGGEGQVLVSDVEARSVIAFPARPGLRGVDDLAFTRDGEVVAATVHVESRAGAEIVLYRIATGDELASPLHLHSPYVRDAGTGARRGIRFADDDQVLVSAGADGVILWDVRDATLERRACELAARGFDDDERRRFFAGRPGGFCGER
jgi:WD40 repeat protein